MSHRHNDIYYHISNMQINIHIIVWTIMDIFYLVFLDQKERLVGQFLRDIALNHIMFYLYGPHLFLYLQLVHQQHILYTSWHINQNNWTHMPTIIKN